MPFPLKNNRDSIPQNTTIIRQANTTDVSELAEIVVSSFYDYSGILSWLNPLLQLTVSEDLRYRLRSNLPLYQCLVATLNRDCETAAMADLDRTPIAGTVEISLRTSFWSPRPQYPYISNLAVKNIYRRQGIARQLLNRCEQIAHSWGYDAIQLHVLNQNNSAKQLYLSSGYKVIQKEPHWNGFFEPNCFRLLLRKKISNG